jgi:hypothetical protein
MGACRILFRDWLFGKPNLSRTTGLNYAEGIYNFAIELWNGYLRNKNVVDSMKFMKQAANLDYENANIVYDQL